MTISMNNEQNKLDIGVRWKAASLGVPLCNTSAHFGAAKKAWKFGELRRCARLSSNPTLFKQAKSVFISRMRSFFETAENLIQLSQYDPYMQLVVKQMFEKQGSVQQKPAKAKAAWIVLPFHKAWERIAPNRILQSIQNKAGMRTLLAECFYPCESPFLDVNIAWKLGCRHFVSGITNLNLEESAGR